MKRKNIRAEWYDWDGNNLENNSLWSPTVEFIMLHRVLSNPKHQFLPLEETIKRWLYDNYSHLQSILHLCTIPYSFHDSTGETSQTQIKRHNSTECIVLTIGPNDTKTLLNTFNFFVVLEPSDIGCWLTTRCLASELHPLSLHNWWGKSSNLWLLRNT